MYSPEEYQAAIKTIRDTRPKGRKEAVQFLIQKLKLRGHSQVYHFCMDCGFGVFSFNDKRGAKQTQGR